MKSGKSPKPRPPRRLLRQDPAASAGKKTRHTPFLSAQCGHFDAMIRNHEKILANSRAMLYNTKVLGDMAQLVERYVRIV